MKKEEIVGKINSMKSEINQSIEKMQETIFKIDKLLEDLEKYTEIKDTRIEMINKVKEINDKKAEEEKKEIIKEQEELVDDLKEKYGKDIVDKAEEFFGKENIKVIDLTKDELDYYQNIVNTVIDCKQNKITVKAAGLEVKKALDETNGAMNFKERVAKEAAKELKNFVNQKKDGKEYKDIKSGKDWTNLINEVLNVKEKIKN